jgi:hypothetical protein
MRLVIAHHPMQSGDQRSMCGNKSFKMRQDVKYLNLPAIDLSLNRYLGLETMHAL